MEHNSMRDIHKQRAPQFFIGNFFCFKGSECPVGKKKPWKNISHTTGNTQRWDSPCQVATDSTVEQWTGWGKSSKGQVTEVTLWNRQQYCWVTSVAIPSWPGKYLKPSLWGAVLSGYRHLFIWFICKKPSEWLPKSWLATSRLPF